MKRLVLVAVLALAACASSASSSTAAAGLSSNGLDEIFLGMNSFNDSYWLFSNTAIGNGGHGIVFAAYPVDPPSDTPPLFFEGNVARDNHTNPQCVNMFCRTS